jgi:N utilization substance protein A
VTTVESLADMTPEQLEAIEGIGPKTVEKISLAVNNYFASLESGEGVAATAEGEEIPAEGVAEESAASAEGAVDTAESATEEAGDEDSTAENVIPVEAEAAAQDGGQAESSESPEEPAPAGGEQQDEEEKQ